jgi:hypothetical protein
VGVEPPRDPNDPLGSSRFSNGLKGRAGFGNHSVRSLYRVNISIGAIPSNEEVCSAQQPLYRNQDVKSIDVEPISLDSIWLFATDSTMGPLCVTAG